MLGRTMQTLWPPTPGVGDRHRSEGRAASPSALRSVRDPTVPRKAPALPTALEEQAPKQTHG